MIPKIIITGRNCFDQMVRCLNSVAEQTFAPFEVCVVDDDSDDGMSAEYVRTFCEVQNWDAIFRPNRCFALKNQVDAIRHLGGYPEDPLIFLDRDDRFAHPYVISDIVADYEADWRRLAIAGNFDCEPESPTSKRAEPFPAEAWSYPRSVRGWMAACGAGAFSHPRSFRRLCFERMTGAGWRYPDGSWLTTAADFALTIPALEMAGPNGVYISDQIRVIYTADQPWSDWHRTDECNRDSDYIWSQPPYSVIPEHEISWRPE